VSSNPSPLLSIHKMSNEKLFKTISKRVKQIHRVQTKLCKPGWHHFHYDDDEQSSAPYVCCSSKNCNNQAVANCEGCGTSICESCWAALRETEPESAKKIRRNIERSKDLDRKKMEILVEPTLMPSSPVDIDMITATDALSQMLF